MAYLELGATTEVGSDRPRRPVSFWIATALAAVLTLVLVAGVAVYLHLRPGPEPPSVAAVREYVAAVNAHDMERLRHVVAPDVVWAAGGGSTIGAGPYKGADYVAFQSALPDFTMELLGDPIVLTDQVTVPVHISAALPGVTSDGVSVYSVVTVGGTTMITEILWVPEPEHR